MKKLLFLTLFFSVALFSCNKEDNDITTETNSEDNTETTFDPNLVGHWKISNVTSNSSFEPSWENGQIDVYISEQGAYYIEVTPRELSTEHASSYGSMSTIINNSKLTIVFDNSTRVFNYSVSNNTLSLSQDEGQVDIKWTVNDYGNQGFYYSPGSGEIHLNNLVKQ
jgi:hypothetical protein